ncbi:MAG: VIT domain-containing protein [Campylobacterota bacterium]|nr:VIT domain-containing protein [Campylobacterota bacterium]
MVKYIILLMGLFTSLLFAELPTLKAEQKSLKISQMRVDIVIVGNIATTTFDIIYYNPYDRDLTGEFSMPLGEGQTISRYALEVNGKLREGVVVEKVKARQTFEAVVRKKIDPGIISLTKGNYFNTKIYPIPAKGHKRVVITTTERLLSDQYILPIQDQEPIDKFTLNIKIIKSSAKGKSILSEFNKLNITQDNSAFLMHFEKENFSLKRPIKFDIPTIDDSGKQLFTQTVAGKTYFYLNVKTPTLQKIDKKSPKDITIYWDNSLSAGKQDKTKELALLDAYLKSIKGTKRVSLVFFNYRLHKTKIFQIDQDTSDLIKTIKRAKNDGGTTLLALEFDQSSDEILLFSDAINTIGGEQVKIGKRPIYAITSAAGSNYNFLKKVSSKSNGDFINLSRLSHQEALDILLTDEEKFLSCSYSKNKISQVYPNLPTRTGREFGITGILKTDKANITINYGGKNGITQKQTFEIKREGDSPVARIWAGQKIDALSLDSEKNQKEIEKLSRKYSILTKGSAFIVLDSVEDYLQYGIPPPKELRREYNTLLAQQKKEFKDEKQSIHTHNLQRIESLKKWYKNPPIVEDEIEETAEREARTDDEEYIAPSEEMGGDIAPMVMPVAEPAPVAKAKLSNNSVDTSIKVLAWLPDAPYMKKLRKVGTKSFDKHYYQFKKVNYNRPAFYIEVSDYLFKRGLHQKAVRVLTNILELDLENPELLKVVAKRLLDEGEYDLAIKIYQEIKTLRPEEPQSYRDLAIAYQQKHEYQKALDIYTYILSKHWGRFDDIKDTIFNEYNALISQHRERLSLKGVKKSYIYPMPLDIRITVSWSSNENDIDLWVVDPDGEKCFYSHPHTKMGGKISKDFTQGYGPEEFSIKEASRGLYTVYLNYFSESRQSITGPVTIHATLTTHYGTKDEKSEKIMIQLESDKKTMQIGLLEYKR